MRAAGVSRETSAAGSDRTQPGRHRPVQQQDQSRVPSPRAATARRVPRRPAGPEPDPDPQSRPAQPRRQRPPPPRQAPWSPPGRTSPPWPSRRCHRTPSGWRRSRCPGRTFSAPAQTPSGIPGPWTGVLDAAVLAARGRSPGQDGLQRELQFHRPGRRVGSGPGDPSQETNQRPALPQLQLQLRPGAGAPGRRLRSDRHGPRHCRRRSPGSPATTRSPPVLSVLSSAPSPRSRGTSTHPDESVRVGVPGHQHQRVTAARRTGQPLPHHLTAPALPGHPAPPGATAEAVVPGPAVTSPASSSAVAPLPPAPLPASPSLSQAGTAQRPSAAARGASQRRNPGQEGRGRRRIVGCVRLSGRPHRPGPGQWPRSTGPARRGPPGPGGTRSNRRRRPGRSGGASSPRDLVLLQRPGAPPGASDRPWGRALRGPRVRVRSGGRGGEPPCGR